MPTATKVNKSEEIRKLHASGIKVVSEIVTKLKARGIKVVPAQVYQAIQKKKVSKAPPATVTTATVSKHSVVDEAIVFVRAAGGMQSAKDLLNKLSQLQN